MPEKRDNTGWYLLGAGALLLLAVGKGFGNMMPPHYSNLTPESQQQAVTWTPQSFIQNFYAIMLQQERQYGIPVAFNFAQLMVESSENGHPAASPLALNACNLYGIKAIGGWTGASWEGYRKYASFKDSIEDHSLFLKNNSRYQVLFDSGSDPVMWASLIQNTGYAEDPAYSLKLSAVLKVIQPILDKLQPQA